MDAILPVYKPVNISSFDVIRAFKRAIRPSYKIGHGGTLDPFADGLLLLLLGKATKQMNNIMTLPKTYLATAILGARSDTLDVTGNIVKSEKFILPSISAIEEAMASLVGKYDQEIPDYSAAKVGGKPRYLLARKGEVMERKTKIVQIHRLSLGRMVDNKITFTSQVSSGTYIRQLSYDIFTKCEIESYLDSLTRTNIGDFSIEKCAMLDEFMTETWKEKLQLLE